MAKKVVRKKVVAKKITPADANQKLIENFIALQKVMTNLSIKFDTLSGNISKLLELFEISAKAMAEKDFELSKGSKEDKEVSQKLDNLLEQNKIIARGLTLLHEKEGPQMSAPPQQMMPPRQMAPSQQMLQQQMQVPSPRPLPQVPPAGQQGYQRSITSTESANQGANQPPKK